MEVVKPIRSLVSLAGLAVALTWGMLATPALAHHSFGHYEMTKISEITGSVSRFEWSNPHCWLFVAVPGGGANGVDVTYGFELQSVGELVRRRWSKTAVKPGEQVTVRFRPMRDGTPAGLMTSVTRDGKLVGRPGVPEPPPPAR
jgi:hypothetical protein